MLRNIHAVDVIVGDHLFSVEYEDVPDEPGAGLPGGLEIRRTIHCCGTRRRELRHLDEPRERLLSDLLYAECELDLGYYWRAKLDEIEEEAC